MIGRRAFAPFLALAFPSAGARAQLFNPGAPTLGERDGLTGPTWTPADLGASLLAWWDAERSDLITQSSGAVSSWRDTVGGYNVIQATGANQPIYSDTSFNGRPGVTGNGTSQFLRLATVPAGIPAGATPCEMWLVVDQTALVADAATRVAFGWGNLSATNRTLQRRVITGTSRAEALVGNNTSGLVATNSTADFSGRHVVRMIVSATATQTDVDAVAGTPTAVVPATATNFLALFAAPNSSSFWQGAISVAGVTALLAAADAAQMYAYLGRRV